jgi:hypothetical protein
MTEYKVNVKSRLIISEKGSKLDEVDIKVNGYRDSSALKYFKEKYNKGEEVKEIEYDGKDWRGMLWYNKLYRDMIRVLKKWKNKKKNRKMSKRNKK